MLTPRDHLIVPFEPGDIPGLVAFWTFKEPGDRFVADQGQPYALESRSGTLAVVADSGAGFGGTALHLDEGQWLSMPREACPELDFAQGHFTLMAWIRRKPTGKRHCEFIAGRWNETDRGRQYGLFLNISVWGVEDRVFGHLSNVGGPTPGYRYCMDGSMSATPVPYGSWTAVGMSYDGQAGYAWFDGVLDLCPGLNPYPMAGGLYSAQGGGSDFTVGAVNRSGEMGNFFHGDIAALAVYRRALTPAEVFALSRKGLPVAGDGPSG